MRAAPTLRCVALARLRKAGVRTCLFYAQAKAITDARRLLELNIQIDSNVSPGARAERSRRNAARSRGDTSVVRESPYVISRRSSESAGADNQLCDDERSQEDCFKQQAYRNQPKDKSDPAIHPGGVCHLLSLIHIAAVLQHGAGPRPWGIATTGVCFVRLSRLRLDCIRRP
jgi:hypothetical protein